jgi:hypothetical protein
MATTVYSGNSATSVVHTNNSGGNQRVLIYYLSVKDSDGSAPIYLRYGGLTNIKLTDGSCRVTIGLKLYYSTNNNNTMSLGIAGGYSDPHPDGSHNEPPAPLEGYISDGQTFEIYGTQYGNILGYNFIVIDE